MKADETVCYGCGTPIPNEGAKSAFGRKFATGSGILFLLCAAMTVLSLFLDMSVSTTKCAICTAVVFIVKSSATEMLERKGRQ
jgi:hypothetical protein